MDQTDQTDLHLKPFPERTPSPKKTKTKKKLHIMLPQLEGQQP